VRLVYALVAALLLIVGAPIGVGAAPRAAAATDTGAAEQEFVRLINGLRASKGLAPLAVHGELTAVARGWATRMAEADRISHNPNLANAVKSDWQKLGENVGVGMDVRKLHDAFVNSPAHYKNLVDPDFTYIGVGVVVGNNGALFTAHEFMQLRAGAAAPAPTAPRATVPKAPRATTTQPPPPPTTEPPTTIPPPPPPASARLILVLEQLQELDG
jgi:hypothetical protein